MKIPLSMSVWCDRKQNHWKWSVHENARVIGKGQEPTPDNAARKAGDHLLVHMMQQKKTKTC